MPNFNQVTLMGNVTRDPQLKQLPNENVVAEFGLACNRKYRTQSGEDREETCFVDCAAFGKQAEVINQYCQKGKPLFVQGRLKYDTWEDKQSGAKRSKLYVIVENFQFLGGGRPGEGAPPQAAEPAGGAQRYRSAAPATAFGAGDPSAPPEMDAPPPVAEEPPADGPAIPF